MVTLLLCHTGITTCTTMINLERVYSVPTPVRYEAPPACNLCEVLYMLSPFQAVFSLSVVTSERLK